MLIQLKKGRDGPDSIACVREDGTRTWRRIQPGLAVHDLVHYAVETELRVADGFFGLVAKGWSMESLVSAEDRPRIPPAAGWVELLVGTFQTEAIGGELYDADAFHETMAMSAAKLGAPLPRKLTDAELARVRGALVALARRWRSLPPGETLELPFAPHVVAAGDGPVDLG